MQAAFGQVEEDIEETKVAPDLVIDEQMDFEDEDAEEEAEKSKISN